MEEDSVESKIKVERYLSDGCELPNNSLFDILAWWKLNMKKYPILSLVVRDVLVIPYSLSMNRLSISAKRQVVTSLQLYRSSNTMHKRNLYKVSHTQYFKAKILNDN